MSARTELAAMLDAAFPDWRVIPHDDKPTISKTTLMVYVQHVEPSNVAPLVDRKYTLVVLVLSAKQTGADDELDEALEDVLEAVEEWDYPTVWLGADRVIYADTYEAYEVTYAVYSQHVMPEPDAALAPEPAPDPTAPEEE